MCQNVPKKLETPLTPCAQGHTPHTPAPRRGFCFVAGRGGARQGEARITRVHSPVPIEGAGEPCDPTYPLHTLQARYPLALASPADVNTTVQALQL